MIRNKINKRQSLWFDYKIKKRLVTSFFAGLILIFSSSLTFALELRLGHFAPVGHPITLATTKAAETIKQLSSIITGFACNGSNTPPIPAPPDI